MRRSLLVLSCVLAVFVMAACSTPEVGLTRLSEPMPTLEGDTVQGGTIASSDLEGHPLVINFWASWCAPCRREQPMLQKLSERYADQGVRFIGVNSRETNEATGRAFVDELGVTYPSIQDPDGKKVFDFDIALGLPGTVVVDSTGTIRYRKQGEITEAELTPLIDEVASASPAPQPS